MKHTLKITLVLILLFVITQVVGLFTVSRYIDIKATSETGVTVINQEKYLISPPEMSESLSWLYIAAAIFIGTALALLIVKFNKVLLWKIWFFLSVFLTLCLGFFPYVELALGGIIPSAAAATTIVLALGFAIWKLFFPNVYVYNITEVFVYSGIAGLLVPILNLLSVIILLVLISIYDFWAVFKTKHMIRLAKFQSSTNQFAGLLVPYTQKTKVKTAKSWKDSGMKNAILGGGDVAFPLLFAGVVLKLTGSFIPAIVVSLFAGLTLLVLFFLAEKDRYYPAMPLITLGCLIGYCVTLLF
jgi:presenilin-like A22 family membrane protease